MADNPNGFQDELQSRSSAEVVIEATIMILITTTAIFGNIMVCWAVFRNKSLRTIPNIYVTALAISDMLVAMISMPVSIEVLITSKFTKPFSFCQFHGFFVFFSGTTSIQIMAAMAINRYYCVVKPSKYRKYFTVRRTIASVVIIVILVAFVVGLPLVCGWVVRNAIHYGKSTCFPTFKTVQEHEKGYITFMSICFFMFPTCVITVCYLKVFRHVRNHQKIAFKNRKQPSDRGKTRADGTQEHQQGNSPEIQTSAQGVQITKPSSATERKDETQEHQQGNSPDLQTSAQGVQITKPSSATERKDGTQEHQQGNSPELQTGAAQRVQITKPSSATERKDETQEHQQGNSPDLQTSAQRVQITKPSTERKDDTQEHQQGNSPDLQTSAQGDQITKPSSERKDGTQELQQGISPELQTSEQGDQITKPSSAIERKDETQEHQQGNSPELQTSAQRVQITKPSTERKDDTQEHQQGIPPKPKINVKEVKITRTLFVTVLGYMACWIPITVIDMIESRFSDTLPIPRQVFLVWVYLLYGSSAINPFIYGVLNRSFRKEFRSILRLKTTNQTHPAPPAVRFRR